MASYYFVSVTNEQSNIKYKLCGKFYKKDCIDESRCNVQGTINENIVYIM